jgi:hypothetical protein
MRKLDQDRRIAGSARQSHDNCAEHRKRGIVGTAASAKAASSLTQNTRLISVAPVGHRQPHTPDIPSQNASDLERIGEEDAAVDRKLNICRGC